MRKMSLGCLLLVLLATFSVAGRADVVTLMSGRRIEGVVLSNDASGVRIRTDVGTMGFYARDVEKVEKSPPQVQEKGQRLLGWKGMMAAIGRGTWGAEVAQIPATVIDKGVLKHVPYLSHRAGDYEFNIYGDPDKPACIEIGIYNNLLGKEAAQLKCREFMRSMLASNAEQAIIDKLKVEGESIEHEGYTFEVTPPTAEDAYGGWWISVYSMKALDASRASEKELVEISRPQNVRITPMAATAPASPATRTTPTIAVADSEEWTAKELTKARKPVTGGGGSVYVRGYYRKDGTYVRPHTRSSPGSGSRRR